MLLKCSDAAAGGTEIVGDLAERYEVTALAEGGRRFEVTIDDAFFPDEAVVRLVTVLDEIEPAWQRHFDWPTVRK